MLETPTAGLLDKTFTKREMLEAIHAHFPVREAGRAGGSAPAVDYEFLDGSGRLGIIGSVTEPFCSSCTHGSASQRMESW